MSLPLWPLRVALYDALTAALPGRTFQPDGASGTDYPFWSFGPVTWSADESDHGGEALYEVQIDVWARKEPSSDTEPIAHELAGELAAAVRAAGELDLGAPHGHALYLGPAASALLDDDDPATGAPLWHVALRFRYRV